MADLEYFIVCRSVSMDVDTDEMTLSGVLEDLFPTAFPYILPRIVAVSAWRLGETEIDDDFQAVLRILRPGERAEDPADFPMNLARGRIRHRAMQGVVEIPLEQAGDLKFEVLLNGRHAAYHIVTVHPVEKDLRQQQQE